MADILQEFGINILEEEIDDVIFQTNEFLCDATFTGSQGPFWWLLVVALSRATNVLGKFCLSALYKFVPCDKNFRRDKNGTKPWRNKAKDRFCSVRPGGLSVCAAKVRICPDIHEPFALNLSLMADYYGKSPPNGCFEYQNKIPFGFFRQLCLKVMPREGDFCASSPNRI